MLASLDQESILLEVVTLEGNGSLKLNVSNGTVMIYRIDAGIKTTVLSSEEMSATGAVWQLVWEPESLPVGEYIVEYTFQDSDGITTMVSEDITVRDIATQMTLSDVSNNLDIVKNIEMGRWKIIGNQMIFYGTDGVAPILTFNLYDADGNPTMTDLFERVPV